MPKYIWDNIVQKNYLCNIGPERSDMFLQENNLRNVVLVCLIICAMETMFAHSPHSSQCFRNMVRKLQMQFWPRAHRYTFTAKPAVSNIPCGLFFKQVEHHGTILALFVRCWIGSSFTACETTMNKGRHWLEHYYWHHLQTSKKGCDRI